MRPSWLPHAESNLRWTWIEGNGPFITNGKSNHPQFETSDFDSDTTTIMFNLDKLNDERLEIMQEQGWAKGCIPKLPDSFVESLVQRVDRGKFRFELGSSSNGSSLTGPQNESLFTNLSHHSPHANPVEESQPSNIGPNVEELSPFKLLTLGPGPSTQLQELLSPTQSTTLWCEENWKVPTDPVTTKGNSRKRLRREFGKLGRNIR